MNTITDQRPRVVHRHTVSPHALVDAQFDLVEHVLAELAGSVRRSIDAGPGFPVNLCCRLAGSTRSLPPPRYELLEHLNAVWAQPPDRPAPTANVEFVGWVWSPVDAAPSPTFGQIEQTPPDDQTVELAHAVDHLRWWASSGSHLGPLPKFAAMVADAAARTLPKRFQR